MISLCTISKVYYVSELTNHLSTTSTGISHHVGSGSEIKINKHDQHVHLYTDTNSMETSSSRAQLYFTCVYVGVDLKFTFHIPKGPVSLADESRRQEG